jgi:hypothetical protein
MRIIAARLEWFLECLDHAFDEAERTLASRGVPLPID